MKKDSIKNFAKKVLTVGFCVPVAFVCSAIPAMAADTASTGGGTASSNTTSITEQQSTSTTGEAQTKESSKVVTPQAVPEKQPSVTETKTDDNNGTPEKTLKAASEEAGDVSTENKQQSVDKTYYTAENFLGDAVNYGVTADTFTLTGGKDAETNVAAKTAQCETQTGNDKTSEQTKQEFIIGHVDQNFKIKGNSNTTVYCPESESSSLTHLDTVQITTYNTSSDTINNAINGLKQIVKVQSDACLQNAAQSGRLKATISYQSKDQKYHLDLPEGQQGTYYVTLDSSIFSNNPDGQNTVGKFRQAESLYITAGEGQSIVFNVTDDFIKTEDTYKEPWDTNAKALPEGTLELTKFNWNGKGSDSADFLGDKNNNLVKDITPATHIIWNLANANLKHVNIVGSIAGVIYAPNAEVKVTSTSAGWIVANTVTIDSGEWHNVSHYEFTPTTPEKIIEDANKIKTPTTETPKSEEGEKQGGNGNQGQSQNDNNGKKDGGGQGTHVDNGGSTPSGSGTTTDEKQDDEKGTNKQDGQTVDQGGKGSSTTTNNDGQPSGQGTTTENNTKDNNQTSSSTQSSDNTGNSGSEVSVTPGGNTTSNPTVTPSDNTPITPTPTLPSVNTGEKNNSQDTNPKTDDNQTTPGTSSSDQTASTTQTKHNDAQDNHSAAGQTTGTQTVKAHAQNAKSTAPAVKRAAAQTSTTAASASAAKSTIPRTADETSLGTELMLFGGAAAALALLLAVKRRKVSK